MDQNEKLIAVLNLLKSSVDNNLNASLTPEECQFLLDVMAGAQRAARSAIRIVERMPPPASPARDNPIEKIVDGLAELGKGFLDDLTDEIRTPGKPRRRKRRV